MMQFVKWNAKIRKFMDLCFYFLGHYNAGVDTLEVGTTGGRIMQEGTMGQGHRGPITEGRMSGTPIMENGEVTVEQEEGVDTEINVGCHLPPGVGQTHPNNNSNNVGGTILASSIVELVRSVS